jgi:hypothetical protein
MKLRKSLFVVGLVVGVFVLVQLGYAYSVMLNLDNQTKAEDNKPVVEKGVADTQEQLDIKDKKPTGGKKSAYSAIETLIVNEIMIPGTKFKMSEFLELRNEFGKKETKDPNYEVGNTMLYTELRDLGISVLGMIERTGEGEYEASAAMNPQQEINIDKWLQDSIPSLGIPDKDRPGQKVGLNAYDIGKMTTNEEKILIRQKVGQELLTGVPIQTDNVNAKSLNNMAYEKVVVLTDEQIQEKSPAVAPNEQKVLQQGCALVIVTTRNLEADPKTGELTKEDNEYVLSVLSDLPMGIEQALKLFKKKQILFSHVPSKMYGEIFAQIEGIAVNSTSNNTLNNVNPAQAKAIIRGV